MNEWMLLVLFIVSAVLGYVIIRNVPALMHTPLMSGMNALSGITVIGAMVVTANASFLILQANSNIGFGAKTLGLIAVVLAMVNVVGGFALTHRMLKMIAGKKTDSKNRFGQAGVVTPVTENLHTKECIDTDSETDADAANQEKADDAGGQHSIGDTSNDMTKGGAS